jgi:hypothetical protein
MKMFVTGSRERAGKHLTQRALRRSAEITEKSL